jgi:hypothetical protein
MCTRQRSLISHLRSQLDTYLVEQEGSPSTWSSRALDGGHLGCADHLDNSYQRGPEGRPAVCPPPISVQGCQAGTAVPGEPSSSSSSASRRCQYGGSAVEIKRIAER